jgi:hypothetical protein
MNNEELDRKAAEIMGGVEHEWRTYGIGIGTKKGLNELNCPWCGYVRWENESIDDRKCERPYSKEWDHAGILIEWAEENGKTLNIRPRFKNGDMAQSCRIVMFSVWKDEEKGVRINFCDPTTPRHITEAFVKAFGGEE